MSPIELCLQLPDDLQEMIMQEYKTHLHKRMLNYQFVKCFQHFRQWVFHGECVLPTDPDPEYEYQYEDLGVIRHVVRIGGFSLSDDIAFEPGSRFGSVAFIRSVF